MTLFSRILSRGLLSALLGVTSFSSLPKAVMADVLTTQGNRVTPIRTGALLNQSRLELIREARHFIYVKTFIFNRDASEHPVFEALCQRARDGLDVRVLVDDLGRRQGGNAIRVHNDAHSIDWFRSCGVRFETYGRPNQGLVEFAIYRQHDKMLVTENGAIIGGTNFSRDYSSHGQLSPRWYDFDIFVQGPATHSLREIFTRSWRETLRAELSANGANPEREASLYSRFSVETLHETDPTPPAAGSAAMTILYNNPFTSAERPFENYFETEIGRLIGDRVAGQKIRLYAPYFIPSESLRHKLIEAKAHGIQVQIITNSASSIDPEAFSAFAAMLNDVAGLLAGGVEIYLWNPAAVRGSGLTRNNVLHKKGGCFGTQSCFVGSHNLDVRGDLYSSELAAVLSDSGFISSQITSFEDDLRYTTQLSESTRRSLLRQSSRWSRFQAWIGGWAM